MLLFFRQTIAPPKNQVLRYFSSTTMVDDAITTFFHFVSLFLHCGVQSKILHIYNSVLLLFVTRCMCVVYAQLAMSFKTFLSMAIGKYFIIHDSIGTISCICSSKPTYVYFLFQWYGQIYY